MLDFIKRKMTFNNQIHDNWEYQKKIIQKRISNSINELNNLFDVPYMIIGGKLVSCLTGFGGDRSDIDIFFYCADDFEKTKSIIENNNLHIECSTENAVTFYLEKRDQKFQIIKTNFGTPQEIFDTIDINCSKIACTRELEFFKDKSFSLNIEVDERNISISTFARLCKYINEKNINYISNDSFLNSFEFNVKQLENKSVDMYGIEFNPCNSIFLSLSTLSNNFINMCLKEICKTRLPLDLMIEKLSNMTTINAGTVEFFRNNLGINDDLTFALFFKNAYFTESKSIIFDKNRFTINEYIRNVIHEKYYLEYPEYFI